jgi:hypothetical protein
MSSTTDMGTGAQTSAGIGRQTTDTSTGMQGGSQSAMGSPVDDHTYNVIQALTSTLEAIEAYGKYQGDARGGIFQQLAQEERQHADRLLEELRSCLTGGG